MRASGFVDHIERLVITGSRKAADCRLQVRYSDFEETLARGVSACVRLQMGDRFRGQCNVQVKVC